jgi:quercetin dioxygenase-like cupin family protein
MKFWKNAATAWRNIRPGVSNRVLYEDHFGSVSLVRFEKGANYPLHKGAVDHLGILIKGSGVFDTGVRTVSLREGDAYFIKPDDDHGFTNTSDADSIMLEIFVPPRQGSASLAQQPEHE